MALLRRRYYIWLFKAYFRRWRKTIITSFVIGGAIFFLIAFFANFYLFPLLEKQVQKVGYWGSYTRQNLPKEVLSDVSYGLTRLDPDGSIKPQAAFRWDIKNNGKKFVFYIKKGQYFHNGKELTARTLSYNFKDVSEQIINDYEVVFTLKDPYAPFLVTVSKPILLSNLAGLGSYKIKNVDLNAGFIKQIIIQDKNNSRVKKIVNFYPTQEALKTAFALGEVDNAFGLTDIQIKNSQLSSWSNTKVYRNPDYTQLVTLFYSNSDSLLSDKKLRQGLTYALPQNFSAGERAFSPIPPTSVYFSKAPNYGITDTQLASNLLVGQKDVFKTTIKITASEDLKKTAEEIAESWKKVGIKSKIDLVSAIPSSFQVLLYSINLPQDPDQYTLWHSGQINNIVKYKNLRIDKLLEDGRSTTDTELRASIYSDFQKYLIDDSPAAFLYFPYAYNVTRK